MQIRPLLGKSEHGVSYQFSRIACCTSGRRLTRMRPSTPSFVPVWCQNGPVHFSCTTGTRSIMTFKTLRKNLFSLIMGALAAFWYHGEFIWWQLTSSGCFRNALCSGLSNIRRLSHTIAFIFVHRTWTKLWTPETFTHSRATSSIVSLHSSSPQVRRVFEGPSSPKRALA